MKHLTIILILISSCCFAQTRTIDINDPISDIDISYTKEEGVTRLTVILNSIETTNNDKVIESSSAIVSIKGLIYWESDCENPKKNILKNIKLGEIGSDKPFVLFADLYDGTNNLLRKPTAENNWEKISFKLNYTINGQAGQTPTLNLYPPIEEMNPELKQIQIISSARQKDIRKGIISLKSMPSGTPFELTSFEIKKTSSSGVETTVLNISEMGDKKYSLNGDLDVEINTNFDIEPLNSTYSVVCKAKMIGNSQVNFEDAGHDIVFVSNIDLFIKNRQSKYSISIPVGENTYIDKNIETEGNGTLGIRFLNSSYQNVRAELEKLDNGKYNIVLKGLAEIPDESSSTFYYTNGKKDISSPLTISKKLPRVSDFSFNGVKEDSLSLSFELPGIDSGIFPTISLSGDKGSFDIGGKSVVKRDDINSNKFNVDISNQIANIVVTDDVVKDVTISVNFGGNTLYSITVTVFNKSLYDAALKKLEEETNQNRRDRDPAKIKELVEEIVEIGKAIGGAVDDTEVTEAINGLQNARSGEVNDVLNDIGKWALIAGKIILPLLAV